MVKSIKLEELKRGDIISYGNSGPKLIVRTLQGGQISTVEKGKDRKGPVLNQEGLAGYVKVNTGTNDSDEYRKKIITTYLERHKQTAAAKEAKSRYAKKRNEIIKQVREVLPVITEYAEMEGVSLSQYISRAVEFYEKNKGQ